MPAPSPVAPAASRLLQQQQQQPAQAPELQRKRHIGFFLRHLRLLPRPYQSGDSQRMTLAFFCLSAMDVLGVVEEKLAAEEREAYRAWIWAQQVPSGGFRGSPALGSGWAISRGNAAEGGHLAMTYTALLNLAILRDDFSQLDRQGIRRLLRATQRSDGR